MVYAKEIYKYNRSNSTNSAAFCAIQGMSFKATFYATQITNPFLNISISANHDKF